MHDQRIEDEGQSTPKQAEKTPHTSTSEGLLLAAVERAQLHGPEGCKGVGWGKVVEHLGLPIGAWTTRRVRPGAEALQATGLLETSKHLGYIEWSLTSKGCERLDAIRSELPPLRGALL